MLLSLAAVALIALGVSLVAAQVRAIVNEVQGKCDFIPCVSSVTVPGLIAGGVLVLIGATAGAFLVRGWLGDRYRSV